jgi:hypothetical protein
MNAADVRTIGPVDTAYPHSHSGGYHSDNSDNPGDDSIDSDSNPVADFGSYNSGLMDVLDSHNPDDSVDYLAGSSAELPPPQQYERKCDSGSQLPHD